MAKDEEKDGLFSINLGDDLIDVSEQTAATETAAKTDDDKTGKTAIPKDEGLQIEVAEDGSFEIDESLKKTIDTQADPNKKAESEDEASIETIEEKEKNKGKAPSDGSSSDSSPSSSPYLAFAKDRAKEGVFLDFNDEDWTGLVEKHEGDEAAALREISDVSIAQTIKQRVQEYKDSLSPEDKALYEAKEKGIPTDQYGIAKHNLEKYSAITEEKLKDNVKLQEELVSKALELRGYTQEEINEEIEGYKALENLEAKAEKARIGLPTVYEKEIKNLEEKAKASEESRKDGIRQRVAKMKKLIDNTPEIVPGIKLTKPTREKIMKSMMNPVARDANGNPMNPVMATRAKNPDGFEMMIHYYHELGLFNIDDDGNMKPDFGKIAKIEKTKAADDMRSAFESVEKTVGGKATIPKTDDDDEEFEAAFGRL
jgi:hypothetical protein